MCDCMHIYYTDMHVALATYIIDILYSSNSKFSWELIASK